MKRPDRAGFTLIELIVVIAIIGTLATLIIPEYGKFISRARSIACMNNLRQIGISVLSYVADNENKYPIIEPNPESELYDPEAEATPLYEELQPYGLTENLLKCPADVKGPNYYQQRNPHTSYQWRPIIDDENAIAPKIYGGRRGAAVRVTKPGRVTICTDFETVHFGRLNRLYGDGHVVATLKDGR
ncbi:MAG: type II secretion system protein [Verrucomicrobiota bacterium]